MSSEKSKKTIYGMNLHEAKFVEAEDDQRRLTDPGFVVLRVAGGWIYMFPDGNVFVPKHNEYKDDDLHGGLPF